MVATRTCGLITFGAVHDIVGKKVLETIQSLMPEGKSVEDFGVDTLAGCEEKAQEDWDNYTDEEREQKKKRMGDHIICY